MQPDLLRASRHIRDFALGALAHANWHANYFSHDNPFWNELSVIQAAHAMELFIKARIAQEHPLLIFSKLPNQQNAVDDLLSASDLIENGQTYSYTELPDRLWAATGIRMQGIDIYRKFGKLRNTIQHFMIPGGIDCGEVAVDFIYRVIDPFINTCWGYFAVDYNEDHEPYEYLVQGLIRRGVPFLVSPSAKLYVQDANEWPDTEYQKLMLARAAEA